MPVDNFGIVDGIESGALLARSAQPDKTSCLALNKLGFNVLYKLNNNEEFPDVTEQDNFNGQVILDPYPKLFNIPTKEHILQTIAFINNTVKEGRNVLVHCTHGRDRTGLVIGAYRIVYDKWTFEQVQAERVYYGAGLITDIPDIKIIEFLKNLDK